MTVESIKYNAPADLLAVYTKKTTAAAAAIKQFIAESSDYTKIKPETLTITCVDGDLYCPAFIAATGLTAFDYALFNSYVEAVLDPMIAMHV